MWMLRQTQGLEPDRQRRQRTTVIDTGTYEVTSTIDMDPGAHENIAI
jgi:hypothetical protein